MILNAPPIDDRNFNDIVSQALDLAKHEHYCPEWKPVENSINGDNTEPGTALVHLFARLMEIIITRLNQVPDKYFLAFLDYIGAQLHPPAPARTLLQFFLADGAKTDQWVPAGSQVSSEETRNLEEQIFETIDHLVITPVNLVNAFTLDPENDQGINHTAVVTGIEAGEIEIFQEQDPGFYLGFDAAFSNDTYSLFFQVTENAGNSRRLQWEYYGKEGWKRLNVQENTRSLSTPGHVRFIGPEDFSQSECFGIRLYWMRIRLIEPAEPFSPKLRRVYMNTVWAENAATVKEELLGSSDGRANQTLQLSRFPVLPGQQVWVIEREMPPKEEYDKIIEEEGEDAVVVTRDEKGIITEIRVRWHEKNNFYVSGPRGRHYVMEPGSAKITFGDGTRGMIPSLGRDNIYCSYYRTGGGVKGNLDPGKITQLKVSLPYIDSVTNVLPASGGVDAETLEEIKTRGPFMLKHRDRAVTVEDFEWLMKEAPGNIAICKCIPAKDWDTTGKVDVIIVPDLDDPKPFPPGSLLYKMENYLYKRCLAPLVDIDSSWVRVRGPGYIKISAAADIIPRNIQQAGRVEEKVIANLENFFHPLKGGPGGKGWTFGRDVHFSEVMEVIQNTGGVDFVKNLRLKAMAQIYNLFLASPVLLYFPSGSTVSSIDSKIKYLLAEEIEETQKIIIKGFKQGDRVKITAKDDPGKIIAEDLSIISVSGDQLTLSFEPSQEIPPGSIVSTADETVKSYIMETINKSESHGTLTLRVKGLEAYEKVIIRCRDVYGYHHEGLVKDIDGDNPVRIYLDPDYLVYSGKHSIKMTLE
jgi:hypothetical protein